MNRTKVTIVVIVALAILILVLFYNKSRMAAKSSVSIRGAIPVSVRTVVKEKVTNAQTLIGTITAYRDVAIVSETQGRVVRVEAEVGQYREAGSTIVQVDDELKQAALASAETNYEKAKKDLERYESLSKQNAATDQQLEGARLAAKAAEAQWIVARRQYRDTKISTPISGIVTSRPVDLGTYVQSGTVVANVVDIGRLKVKLNVAEKDVFRLKPGEAVEVTTDQYPGVAYRGTIGTISSKSDEVHTYPVEITLPNSREHPLKAGMFCRVGFSSMSAEAVTIPREALVGSVKNPQVFVVKGSVARLRDILVGGEFATSLAVLKGLAAGETVVVSGQNNLKDSTSVSLEQ
jgi:RND family efflux transporter MFP subunit